MQAKKAVKPIKMDTVRKSGTVLVAVGTIMKAGVEIVKALSRTKK